MDTPIEGVVNMQEEVFPALIEGATNPTFKALFAYTTCFDDSIHTCVWGDDGFILDTCEGWLIDYYRNHKEFLPEFMHHFIKMVYDGE